MPAIRGQNTVFLSARCDRLPVITLSGAMQKRLTAKQLPYSVIPIRTQQTLFDGSVIVTVAYFSNSMELVCNVLSIS
jgi:hypothetical protein